MNYTNKMVKMSSLLFLLFEVPILNICTHIR